jgi:hypothetical protein
LLALLLRLIPKIGPLRMFAFHPAKPETEKHFMDSLYRLSKILAEK